MPTFLNVQKINKNKDFLSKSPSHQVIFCSKQMDFDPAEKDNIFLRGILMIGNDCNMNKKISD